MDAAAIIGCGHGPVERMVRSGVIERRVAARGLPSLRRSSVEAAANIWRQEQAAREVAPRTKQRRLTDPPDDGNVWVGSEVAALVMGITANRVRQLAKVGRLPATVRGRKLWFRREDVERAAAARVFARRAESSDAASETREAGLAPVIPHLRRRRDFDPESPRGASYTDVRRHGVPRTYLTSAEVSEMTGLAEEALVETILVEDDATPPGFAGPDGALWFNATAVRAWMGRHGLGR